MECKKDIGGKFKSRSTSNAKVISTTYYVNCLFIPNPQGHRLFPNSMTTVVQSAVLCFSEQLSSELGQRQWVLA